MILTRWYDFIGFDFGVGESVALGIDGACSVVVVKRATESPHLKIAFKWLLHTLFMALCSMLSCHYASR